MSFWHNFDTLQAPCLAAIPPSFICVKSWPHIRQIVAIFGGRVNQDGSTSANEWGVRSQRAPDAVKGALVCGAPEVVSSKVTRKLMVGTNISIPVSITVQAQQGMSDDEARKQSRVMGASSESQIRKTVMDMPLRMMSCITVFNTMDR
ncbi:hypothetical protein C7H10_14920 [Marinobacter shengliensis]|nr:hypothetical protein C7H10_14920 [Marinobacter shengliensis]